VLSVVAVLLTVDMIALALIARAEEGHRPPALTPSSPHDLSSPGKQTEQRALITVTDGRLNLRVQSRPLGWVLEEVSREGRVAIIADGVGGQRISAQFQDIPLDEALRQLLKDHDAFFFYGPEKTKPASLRAVWVYPKGRGRGLAPVPPEAWASTKEMLEEAEANPDPGARARAIQTVVERKGNRALDLVLGALQDVDDRVRTRALFAALGEGVRLPADSLIALAITDPSHNVRFLALEALVGQKDPNVRATAEQALNDPHPHVRNKAQDILNRLDAAARPPESSQSLQGQRQPGGQ
jgi:hypothetical protein